MQRAQVRMLKRIRVIRLGFRSSLLDDATWDEQRPELTEMSHIDDLKLPPGQMSDRRCEGLVQLHRQWCLPLVSGLPFLPHHPRFLVPPSLIWRGGRVNISKSARGVGPLPSCWHFCRFRTCANILVIWVRRRARGRSQAGRRRLPMQTVQVHQQLRRHGQKSQQLPTLRHTPRIQMMESRISVCKT